MLLKEGYSGFGILLEFICCEPYSFLLVVPMQFRHKALSLMHRFRAFKATLRRNQVKRDRSIEKGRFK